jgi:hypothetical protein
MGADKEEGQERGDYFVKLITKSNIHIAKTKFIDFQFFSTKQITHKDNSIENHREFLQKFKKLKHQ